MISGALVALSLLGISGPAPQRPEPPSRASAAAKPPAALPSPPPRQQPDAQQAQILEAMGYAWDGKRWGRGGDPTSRERARASCRSGNRFARLVDADGAPVGSASAVAAVKRFESLLQAARADATAASSSDAARARSVRVKDLLAQPLAPAAWLAAQLGAVCALSAHLYGGLGGLGAQLQGATAAQVGTGLALGAVAALCRAAGREAQPGVEEPDGALERLLADGMEGAHAMPTPMHIRFESNAWRARALGAEALAGLTVSLALQAGAQGACLEATANALAWRLVAAAGESDLGQQAALVGPLAAALLVAAPAAARAALHAAPPLDGIPAELGAAARARRGAASYFSMCPPPGGEPADAAAALAALADGWMAKFERSPGAPSPRAAQAAGAFGASIAYALAWQLAGGALVAPVLARAVAAAATYLPGAAGVEAARVTVRLPPATRAAGEPE